MQINITDKLYNDIKSYCSCNDIDLDGFIESTLKKGFMLEKYGEKPFYQNNPDNEQKQAQETIENNDKETPPESDVKQEVKKEKKEKQTKKETKKTVVEEKTPTTEEVKTKKRKLNVI